MQRSHLAADLATSYVRGTRAAVQEVRSQRAVSRGSIRSHHYRHWQLYVSQGPVPVPRLPKFPSSPRLCSWPSPILSNSCCRRHRRCRRRRRRRRLRYSIVDRHPAQPSPHGDHETGKQAEQLFFPLVAAKMPGTSRIPVSLRQGFNNVRKRSRVSNPLQMLNLDLSVAACPSRPLPR